jgi:hypothetical protein
MENMAFFPVLRNSSRCRQSILRYFCQLAKNIRRHDFENLNFEKCFFFYLYVLELGHRHL